MNVYRNSELPSQNVHLLTIKKTLGGKAYVDPSEIQAELERIYKKLLKLNECWEIDRNGILHCHSLVVAPPRFFFKKLHKHGWHIHNVRVYSDDVEGYLHKQGGTPEKDEYVRLKYVEQNLYCEEYMFDN